MALIGVDRKLDATESGRVLTTRDLGLLERCKKTMSKANTTEVKDEESPEIDVNFNAHAIAGAWEATENVPVCVAVAITNEFTDHTVTEQDGKEADRDVYFKNAGILFEEKAVGVCHRRIAEKYAQGYVELERGDNKVLAISPAQIFENQPF